MSLLKKAIRFTYFGTMKEDRFIGKVRPELARQYISKLTCEKSKRLARVGF